jgi:hypothetical protein
MKIAPFRDTRWKVVWVLLSVGALALLAVAVRDAAFRADAIRGIAVLLDSKASAAVVAGLAACLGVFVYHWVDARRREREGRAYPQRLLYERRAAFVDECLGRVHRLEDLVYEVLVLMERGDRESASAAYSKLSSSDEFAALSAAVRRAEVYLPPSLLRSTTALHRSWKNLLQQRSAEASGEMHRALANFRNALRALTGTDSPSYSLQVAFNETSR